MKTKSNRYFPSIAQVARENIQAMFPRAKKITVDIKKIATKKNGNQYESQIQVFTKKQVLRAKKIASNPKIVLDKSLNAIARQIDKLKTKQHNLKLKSPLSEF